MKYQVFLKVANGGVTPVFQTNSRGHALGYCVAKNNFYKSVFSPNVCFFEEV